MPVNSGLFCAASNYGRGAIQDWSSYDFSVLRISGKDTTLKSLGRPLNTTGFDGDFYTTASPTVGDSMLPWTGNTCSIPGEPAKRTAISIG
jgi:hypothetical protein